MLNTWILWWNTQAVPFSARWWNAPIFHPMDGAFALSEHLAGIAAWTAPLALAGLNPPGVYNLALIAGCTLSGFFMFLLVRHLTGSASAGIVSGIAFAFAPYRGGQLAHLQVLHSQWMPLALLAMHTYLADGRWPWLLVLAVAWVALGLSNGYFLLFFPVLLAFWFAWFATGRDATHPMRLRRAAALMGTLAFASLPLIPVLLAYKTIHASLGITRPVEEMIRFSASPASLLHAAPLARVWPKATTTTQETSLFVGLTIGILALVAVALPLKGASLGALVRRRSPVLFYATAAGLMYWLAMGPARDEGVVEVLRFPYTVLTRIPGFDGLRVPARFATPGTLCVAVLCGFAMHWIVSLRPVPRVAGITLVLVGLLADASLDPVPLVPPPQRVMMPEVRDAVVLELPAHDLGVNVSAMYRSITHRRPLVNGFSGHVPPHFRVLNTALVRQDPSVLWWLAAGRPLVVIVHRTLEPDGTTRAYVERAGGVLYGESGVGPVFVLPPRARERQRPALPALAGVETSQPAPAVTIADLGGEHRVQGISFAARWRYDDVPERMTIEVSPDGSSWTTAWEDWTGAAMLAGALEHQRDVIVRIPLPDSAARFLRVQPAPRWLADELRVHQAGAF